MGRVAAVALIETVLAVPGPVADLVLREAVLVQAREETRGHVALPVSNFCCQYICLSIGVVKNRTWLVGSEECTQSQ